MEEFMENEEKNNTKPLTSSDVKVLVDAKEQALPEGQVLPKEQTVSEEQAISEEQAVSEEQSHHSKMSDMKYFLSQTLQEIQSIGYVKPEEIPNIDLYMDQVTTFMDDRLSGSKRHDTDKLLTKTMINNYTKNNLLPPPEKKKYSREHVLTLIFIYYFKNFLNFNDIETLLHPLTESYFGNKEGFNMQDVYKEVFQLEEGEMKKLLKYLGKNYAAANETFNDFPEEDQDFLHQFSFICQLSYDIYLKKMIIERMIDRMRQSQDGNE